MYQAPALMYDSIEIIFPISPSQCILLNRQGINGYIDSDLKAVDNSNRIMRAHSHENYISNQNKTNDFWFHVDEEPQDSWRNQHKQKANNHQENNTNP